MGFHRIASGRPSMTWSESVDEALCFGWIDGVRRRIDAQRYEIRFTPRKAGSTWSAINIDKVRALTAAGRMAPAGLAAFERRSEARSRTYSYEQRKSLTLDAASRRALRADTAAWAYWEKQPPGYRQLITFWLASAKKEETRARRREKLVAACRKKVRL